MKKKSATALSELAKKSVTCATLEKLSDGGDRGKSQRCAHIDKKVSDGFVRAGKKYQRRARSGKKVSDVRNLKKKSATDSCDMEKSQRHAQPGTQSATGATCEKIPRRAQPEKEVSDGLNLGKHQRLAHLEKEFSDVPERTVKKDSDRHISKKTATGATWKRSPRRPCASWQKSRRHAQPGKKSATGAACEKKSQRRAQAEKQVSDGLVRPGKKSAMCAHWQRSQRRIHASWQKISATGAIWEKKSATCATWDTISDRRDLWKNSATGATWKRSQRRA